MPFSERETEKGNQNREVVPFLEGGIEKGNQIAEVMPKTVEPTRKK